MSIYGRFDFASYCGSGAGRKDGLFPRCIDKDRPFEFISSPRTQNFKDDLLLASKGPSHVRLDHPNL